MIHALLLALAAAPPPPTTAPSSVGVRMYQSGADAGLARSINVVGAQVTCDAGTAYCTLFVDGGGGAPTGAQYWVGAADGTLSAEKNLGALSTGLVLNTGGTPSAYAGSTCAAGQHASQASASGALTCSAAPGVPGGSSPQVQYNNAGAFGGMTNFTSDGTRPDVIAETSHPSAPAATDHSLFYDHLVSTGMPVRTMHLDKALGIPMPQGMLWQFSLLGTAANWRVTGCAPVGFATFSFTELGDTGAGVCTTGSGSCSGSAPAWASTDLYTRSPALLMTKTSPGASNIWCGFDYNGTGAGHIWRGNVAGAGGFFWWTRLFVVTAPNDTMSINKMFAGLAATTVALTGTSQPSAFADTAYFGLDLGEAQTLRFCTNDNTGSATCGTDLGANFPVQTGAWYDLYIWAPPNGSAVYGAAQRLDSAQNSGLITASSDLPRNTVQLTWHTQLGSGGADAGVTALATGGILAAWNY